MKVLCFALFACAFNLLIGFTGLLSFGHAAFFGGAAYACGYALTKLGLPMELGLILGTRERRRARLGVGLPGDPPAGHLLFDDHAGAGADAVFLLPAGALHRRRGWPAGVPRGKLLGMVDLANDLLLYYVVLAIAVAGFALIVRVVHSPFGQILKAIKENEAARISLGYDVDRLQAAGFRLLGGAGRTGGSDQDAGARFRDADRRALGMSGLVILMTLVGGMGTFVGPIVGAVIIIALENKLGDIGDFLAAVTGIEWFGAIGGSVTMVTGAIFMACVLAFRQGVIGELLILTGRRQQTTDAPHG